MFLAERLDVPLRDRNQLLLSAGFAPVYGDRRLDDPAMEDVREPGQRVVLPLEYRTAHGVLRFLNTTTSFGAPLDAALSEVVIEAFYPADEWHTLLRGAMSNMTHRWGRVRLLKRRDLLADPPENR